MTWTYSGNPADSDRDAVRYLVGDTDFGNQLVQDAEIAWVLTEEGNVYLAAASVARGIGATFAEAVTKQVGDLKIQSQQKRDNFKKLADELKERGVLRAGRPYAGGISIDDKQTVRDDDDRVVPAFRKRQHDRDDTSQDRLVKDYQEREP
jgi:hypothetical protein